MSKGQSKPETVSVRIREDDYAQIREIANFYNVKVVDAIESFVKLWGMLDKEDQDLVFLGEPIEEDVPPIIFKSDPHETSHVTYKKTPPSP
ncbi:MAG: hypothetical protein GOVbin1630_55 [Prokaryotic dsDNA virus sp.]|mgnify:CR=1 FL=1|nr:MAG: hypothetical protein GOVbin1630_55 [Prokaryotic dsDNA virus sp.]|tara:strand:- start:8825 stop:9097 length:273 start_codon:yes stop_codon:yes gene_type:complete